MALANPKFEDSYGRLFGPDIGLSEQTDAFFRKFYQHFLRHPAIAAMFSNTDMDQQVQMLKRSLMHLVAFYVTGNPSDELKRMAAIHHRLNVRSEHFDLWLDAILQTVQETDPKADEATLLAWCWALTPGITYMRLSQELHGLG